MADRLVYADNAGTTAMSKKALDAMMPFMTEIYGNPSAIYSVGREAKKALEAVVANISKALAAGDKVGLVGFGTFSVAARGARQGINPATKKPITIAAKKVAKFKAGAELADAIK